MGPDAAAKARAIRQMLAGSGISLPAVVQDQSALLNQIASDAGAVPWTGDEAGKAIGIRLVQFTGAPPPRSAAVAAAPAYDDALKHADAVAAELHGQLPDADARGSVTIQRVDELYDLLGRSILYRAGDTLARDPSASVSPAR